MERKIETKSLGAQTNEAEVQKRESPKETEPPKLGPAIPDLLRQALIWIMALSVAVGGYFSCLISSKVHWSLGWFSSTALLPGLSFGLVSGGWLLYRRWISIGRAVGFVIGSTLGYFAAYWTAFYILSFCSKGMVPALRLLLFQIGMIAGAVGTTLLTASFAAVSADFRRKNWKRLIIIGTAAGGALLLAGIGAKQTGHLGELDNPGDRLFIFLWQLLVSGYIATLLFPSRRRSANQSERGSKIAQWTTRAVVALLMLSLVHAAIGFWRGGKEHLVEEQKAKQQTFETRATASSEQGNTPQAEAQAQAITFGGTWYLRLPLNGIDNLELLKVTKLQNVSGKPIKAFKAILYRIDDFGEVLSKEELEFSSFSRYGPPDQKTESHVIQPKEVIYMHRLNLQDVRYALPINEIFEKVGRDQKALDAKAVDLDPKHFRLELQRVVFND
jgi:MFS family permease